MEVQIIAEVKICSGLQSSWKVYGTGIYRNKLNAERNCNILWNIVTREYGRTVENTATDLNYPGGWQFAVSSSVEVEKDTL
jgi:hypothetical protein